MAFVYLMAWSLHVNPDVEAFFLNSVMIFIKMSGVEYMAMSKFDFGSVHDLYAVSVLKHGAGIVGHLP